MPEAVERALAELERWQPVTNAFSQVFADEARAAEPRTGPLAGVPVAVKDLFDMAGKETTGCCAAYAGTVATGDADAVRRLRDAGAVIVGKTNQHELALGSTGLISACGPAHNPWDPARITGGSSSGSAAAVAAGVVPIALGTDTGGSIRMPASFCGVFGLKPTHGRLSLEGVMPLAVSLDCPGPLAATANDLSLAWEVLSGERPDAPAATRVAVLDTRRVTQDVLSAIQSTAEAFEKLGAATSTAPDEIAEAPELWVTIALPEAYRDHKVLMERRDSVHPVILMLIELGAAVTPEQREEARGKVAELTAWFERQLADVDVLLMPATPYAAPHATDEQVEVLDGSAIDVHVGGPSTFTRPINLIGFPSVVVPAGRTQDGLPLAVQIAGRRGSEAMLLATAAALEAADERFRTGTPALP
jgi:aspartyl-tRNA(Asn)/glutamyl-tRNA(Gln) amidotransferase subunit A